MASMRFIDACVLEEVDMVGSVEEVNCGGRLPHFISGKCVCILMTIQRPYFHNCSMRCAHRASERVG